jgi:cellulase/cellobiase CelA1
MYIKQSEWSNGFVVNVTLTNTGSTPLRGWTLAFQYSAGQKLISYWNAIASQDGASVTVGPTNDRPVLDPGKSITFGLQGTWQTRNPVPAAFTVNGSPCG